MNKLNGKKIHKAWLMLAACCLLMANWTVLTTCLSFLTKPVSEALGFTRGSFTVYITIISLVGAVSMPIWSEILVKIGIKAMITIGGTVGGLTIIAMGHFHTLTQFYIAAVLAGLAMTSISLLPTSVIINNWFVEKKGLAMGIAMAFTGLTGTIYSPILVRVLESSGWETVYTVLGVSVLVFSLPVTWFVLQVHPSKLKLCAYGARDEAESTQGKVIALTGVSSSVALRSLALWIIVMIIFVENIGFVSFLQHIPAFLVGKGLTTIQTGTMMSICMISLIFVKICYGWLSDRFGLIKVLQFAFACSFLAFVLLLFVKNQALASIAMILLSFPLAIGIVFPPLITGKMFGQKDFAFIYSIISGMGTLGYGIGVPLYGLAFDKTGSYTIMIYVAIIIAIVAIVLVPISFKASEKIHRSQSKDIYTNY